MDDKNQKDEALVLLRRSEKYFYKYLLTHDSVYIHRFFSVTKKLERLLEMLSQT